MNREKLEIFKQKYASEYEKFLNQFDKDTAEKLFYEYAKAKEKLKQTKEKIQAISEKERKREARALIIFAKLILKNIKKDEILNFIEQHRQEFTQKERGKEIDYSKYLVKFLEEKDNI